MKFTSLTIVEFHRLQELNHLKATNEFTLSSSLNKLKKFKEK